MNLLILLISFFSYFSSDEGDIMKDGHMWKTISINAYYQSSDKVYDSLTLFDTKWDSIITDKCGEDFRPATLGDYWNTQFEYMEHVGMIYYYAGTNLGVGQAPYQMASTTTDSVVGGWNQYKTFTKRLTLEPKLTNLPVNQYTTAGSSKYDSINNIPFKHYQQIIAMQPNINIACVSISRIKPNTVIIDTFHRIDTININDTLRINTIDTVYKKDTLFKHDTIKVVIHDTLKIDSIIRTTVTVHDTVRIQLPPIRDTIRTTIFKIDTFKVHDTVNSCSLTNQFYYETLNQSMYAGSSSKGLQLWQSTDSSTWTDGSQNQPIDYFNKIISVKFQTNIPINVAVYIYDNIGTFVTYGKFQTNSKNNSLKYLTWDGKAATGHKVTAGVYLIRVIAEYNNHVSNNVYRIGIK